MADSGLPLSGAHWVDHVARHAEARPDEVAIRFEGTSTTWEQLHDRVRRLSGALAARGVARGDRVAVLMGNRPEFVETVLATNAAGAIAVPVNFRLTLAETAYVLRDSGARVLVADGAFADLAVTAAHDAGDDVRVVVAGSPEHAARDDAESYTSLLGEDSDPPAVAIEERDVALIMYTSGTTGRPKGAMITHLNLLTQVTVAYRIGRLQPDGTVTLLNVPLFHIAGIGSSLSPSLLAGGRTVIMPTETFDAERTLDVVEAEGVTSLFLVPAQWQALCAHPDATRRTRSLRTISWGAAPASESLLRDMARAFPHASIVSTFGQTEMSPVTTALTAEDAVRKIGSVGRPVPTVAVRIVDEDMNDVAPGEVGEIVYRGPGLMAGYWNRPQETADAFHGGWFHSGDLVRADDDGFIYVVDRKKDMIISGGENIYCAEVENALAGHPAIADVAVIGLAHARWGETPAAVVVPTDAAAPPTLDELVDWTRDRLASYKKPTQLIVLDEMPRNASGKVLKHRLRAAYGHGGTETTA